MRTRLHSFTLVELLVALSILSVIAYLSATSFVSVRKITDWADENSDLGNRVSGIMESLNREISSAVYVSSNKRTIFKSVRTDNGETKTNDLRFCYIDPISIYETKKRDEIIEVEYKVVNDENHNGKYKIVKRVWYYPMEPNKPEERDPDVSYTILNNVDYFMMRFYLRGKWFNSWDTDKMRQLPEMIVLDFSVKGKLYTGSFNVYISEL